MKDYNRDFFKLSFDKGNTEFYVNEKKKTVTCKVECTLLVPYSWDSPVNIYPKSFYIVATARCCENDVFDVERGKRIAMAKAENKAYTQAQCYLAEQLEHLTFMSVRIRNFAEKTSHQCTHNVEYIDRMSNTSNPDYKEILTGVKSGKTFYKFGKDNVEKKTFEFHVK